MQAVMPRIPPTLGTPELPSISAPDHPAPKRRRRWVWLALLAIVPIVASHLLVVALRWLPLPTSAVMLQSPTQPVQYRWVPSSQIAEVAGRAVIAAEDQRFREHGGLDFEAIEKALEYNQKSRRTRGASTISQQVAKNVFLWNGRSWLRKGLEVYATLLIELAWGKDRILEVYLNVAEFGPGIYGVEAAAQKYFDRPAARLSAEQAARLAAVLPSPRRWSAANPGPYVLKRQAWILRQMGFRDAPPASGPPADAEPEESLPADTDEFEAEPAADGGVAIPPEGEPAAEADANPEASGPEPTDPDPSGPNQ